MQTRVSLNKYRKSAQKVREVTKHLRGMDMLEVFNFLNHSDKGCARDLKKLIQSAIANAKNNHNQKEEDLYIKEIFANEKMTMKRWRARAYGRAAGILKRTCSVEIVLDEKELVKKEKTEKIKEQLKEIKDKEDKKIDNKLKDDKREGKKVEEATAEKRVNNFQDKNGPVNTREKMGSKGGTKNKAQKVFRRKSF